MSKERGREHGRLETFETASELKKKLLTLNLSSRRPYEHHANISGHIVCKCTLARLCVVTSELCKYESSTAVSFCLYLLQ